MAAESAFAAAAASLLWGRQDGYSPTSHSGESQEQKENLVIFNNAQSDLIPMLEAYRRDSSLALRPGFIPWDLSDLLFSIINKILCI